MGPGIAASFAAAGYKTSIWARREHAAARGAEVAERHRLMLLEHELATYSEPPVESTDELGNALAGAQVVVEAISEDPQAKRDLVAKIERFVDDETLLTSTTSGLDPDQISEGAAHPGRFVVMHFWNPAHLIALVEVLGSSRSETQAVELACDLVRQLGKHPVRLSRFVPGFLGARLQQAVIREAISLLEAGIASAEDIDATTRLSFGARFPIIGPLETTDLGGLDVFAAIHEYLLPDLDCSQEPQATLVDLVRAGHLGSKTGRGFYDWSRRDAEKLTRMRDEELIGRLQSLIRQGYLSVPGGGSETKDRL